MISTAVDGPKIHKEFSSFKLKEFSEIYPEFRFSYKPIEKDSSFLKILVPDYFDFGLKIDRDFPEELIEELIELISSAEIKKFNDHIVLWDTVHLNYWPSRGNRSEDKIGRQYIEEILSKDWPPVRKILALACGATILPKIGYEKTLRLAESKKDNDFLQLPQSLKILYSYLIPGVTMKTRDSTLKLGNADKDMIIARYSTHSMVEVTAFICTMNDSSYTKTFRKFLEQWDGSTEVDGHLDDTEHLDTLIGLYNSRYSEECLDLNPFEMYELAAITLNSHHYELPIEHLISRASKLGLQSQNQRSPRPLVSNTPSDIKFSVYLTRAVIDEISKSFSDSESFDEFNSMMDRFSPLGVIPAILSEILVKLGKSRVTEIITFLTQAWSDHPSKRSSNNYEDKARICSVLSEVFENKDYPFSWIVNMSDNSKSIIPERDILLNAFKSGFHMTITSV